MKPSLPHRYSHLRLANIKSMNSDQFDQLITVLTQLTINTDRIANALERMAPQTTAAPSYQRPLDEFPTFDWESIGAEVVKSDRYGAGVVIWQGKQFVRRSPENEFGASVWFARCVGKDEQGRNKYERLITFSPIQERKVKPVSREVEAMLSR
jgi:DdrB-like protein